MTDDKTDKHSDSQRVSDPPHPSSNISLKANANNSTGSVANGNGLTVNHATGNSTTGNQTAGNLMTGNHTQSDKSVRIATKDSNTKQHSNQNTSSNQTHNQAANLTHRQAGNPTESMDSLDSSKVRWRLDCLKSSEIFKRIMGDLETRMAERLRILEASKQEKGPHKTETVSDPGGGGVLLDFGEEAGDGSGDEGGDVEDDRRNTRHNVHLPRRVRARRAWAIVRRHIREQAMARQNKSSLQWSMLKHTLKNMSNMEAGRATLYQKYLDPSNPREWTQGIRSIPDDFFARNRNIAVQRTRDHATNTHKSKIKVSSGQKVSTMAGKPVVEQNVIHTGQKQHLQGQTASRTKLKLKSAASHVSVKSNSTTQRNVHTKCR